MADGLYAVGLVSTDADPRKIVGDGTGWNNTNTKPGDVFEQAGVRVTILAVDGAEELTLPYDWPGPALSDDPYVIVQSSPLRYSTVALSSDIGALIEKTKIFGTPSSSALLSVKQFGVNTPPVDYALDEGLIVGATPTGDFTGHANEHARKTANGWYFTAPLHGWIAVTQESGHAARVWDDTEWDSVGSLVGSPRWAGVWNVATPYDPGEVVSRLGKTYAADVETTGDPPESSPDEWSPYSDLGEHGGAMQFAYRFRTAFTPEAADVAGQLNFDNEPGSATKLRINPLDVFGNDWGALLAGIDTASTSDTKGKLRLKVPGDGGRQFVASVTGAVLVGGRYELALSGPVLGGAALADDSDILFFFDDKGDEGQPGVPGEQGLRGFVGGPIALPFIFASENADADPTDGKVRLSHPTQEDSNVLRVDLLTSAGAPVTALLDAIPVIGTGTVKAIGSLVHRDTPETKWLIFKVLDVAIAAGYRNLPIEIMASSEADPLTPDDPLVLSLHPIEKGDTGPTGDTGPQGESFYPLHVVSSLTERADYDDGPAVDVNGRPLSVLVEVDSEHGGVPMLYFLLVAAEGAEPAIWTQGSRFSPEANAAGITFDNDEVALPNAPSNAQAAIKEVAALARRLDIAWEDVASAPTTDLASTISYKVNVTGAYQGVVDFGVTPNQYRIVRWAGACRVINDPLKINLLGGAARLMLPGARSELVSDASGVWWENWYTVGPVQIVSEGAGYGQFNVPHVGGFGTAAFFNRDDLVGYNTIGFGADRTICAHEDRSLFLCTTNPPSLPVTLTTPPVEDCGVGWNALICADRVDVIVTSSDASFINSWDGSVLIPAGKSGLLTWTALGWMLLVSDQQNEKTTTANFDKTNTTLADVPGLAIKMVSGNGSRGYRFSALLFVTPTTAGGSKVAIVVSGTPSLIRYYIKCENYSVNPPAALYGGMHTASGGASSNNGGTAHLIQIDGYILGAASELKVQFAQHAASGTSTLLPGSLLTVKPESLL